MLGYKLLRVRKNGTIGPLFINKTQIITIGEWLESGCYPTPGFAVRPGWHVMAKPEAPHLCLDGRRWYLVEIKDFETHMRPNSQGGIWYLSKYMKVIQPLVGITTINKPSKKK